MASRKLGSVKATDFVLITSVNLTADVTGVLPVANGGNGTGTFTDGQILIGTTAGNTLTKTTLTGTSNQVVVTNGSGSITLSTPQSIGTGSSPTFTNLTLTGTLTAGSGPTVVTDSTGKLLLNVGKLSVSSVSVDTTLTTQDVVFASGTCTLTLPSAVTTTRVIVIKNVGTGTVKVVGPSSQTIDGDTQLDVNVQYASYTLVSNGTNWFIL